MNPQRSKDGSTHVTDEMINTVTHLAAACLAVLGSALLIGQAAFSGNVWAIVGFSIYSLSLLNLFIFSTLHHGINGSEPTNRLLRTFDYLAVFVLIAGTVTPLVLVLDRDVFGWSVLGAVWLIAGIGIALRSVYKELPKHITNTLYIVLGWIPAVLVLDQNKLPLGALLLLLIGGLFYCVGFAVYVIEKPNPRPGKFGFHEIWHVLVVLGAACHFLMMYLFVL